MAFLWGFLVGWLVWGFFGLFVFLKNNSDGPASEIRDESYAPLYSVKQLAHLL